jgi:hypothetical protein
MKLGVSCPKMSFFIPERGIFSKNRVSFQFLFFFFKRKLQKITPHLALAFDDKLTEERLIL